MFFQTPKKVSFGGVYIKWSLQHNATTEKFPVPFQLSHIVAHCFVVVASEWIHSLLPVSACNLSSVSVLTKLSSLYCRSSTRKQWSDGKAKFVILGNLPVHMEVKLVELTLTSAAVLGLKVEFATRISPSFAGVEVLLHCML